MGVHFLELTHLLKVECNITGSVRGQSKVQSAPVAPGVRCVNHTDVLALYLVVSCWQLVRRICSTERWQWRRPARQVSGETTLNATPEAVTVRSGWSFHGSC